MTHSTIEPTALYTRKAGTLTLEVFQLEYVYIITCTDLDGYDVYEYNEEIQTTYATCTEAREAVDAQFTVIMGF